MFTPTSEVRSSMFIEPLEHPGNIWGLFPRLPGQVSDGS
jgi:hypothetical protein